MRPWVYRMSELLYAATLLTVITADPDITISLRVNHKVMSSTEFNYPNLRTTAIESLFLTALAMVPMLGLMPHRMAGRRRYNYLVMAPWILACCLKFLLHACMHMFAIRQVTKYSDPSALTIALAIYCIVFGMATEIVKHWIAIANVLGDGNVLVLM